MSAPQLAPRSPFPAIIAVWGLGAVIAVVVGIFAPVAVQAVWLCVGLGVCLIAAFAVQVLSGRAQGFIFRVSASVLGAFIVMGLVSAGFGLALLAAL
ncbi:hypothetical protein [Microbacterium gorillae]|uniref:hypothetical protein n=1 Tax=Microbacterium gorillae TaxID=1231063 RepID=UPI000590B21A|nr:hypothetical protein [Microbacterium gorillae]